MPGESGYINVLFILRRCNFVRVSTTNIKNNYMKQMIIIAAFALCSCGRESSPEGRMQIRAEHLQASLDGLKIQNKAILDSIVSIRQELRVRRTEVD